MLRGANLDHYEGEWRDGVRCGAGTQKLGPTGDVLVGTWDQDAMVGRGRLTTGRGDVYEGEFARSLREGDGECKYADGSVYRGGWVGGVFHGEGTLLARAGRSARARGTAARWSGTAGACTTPARRTWASLRAGCATARAAGGRRPLGATLRGRVGGGPARGRRRVRRRRRRAHGRHVEGRSPLHGPSAAR